MMANTVSDLKKQLEAIDGSLQTEAAICQTIDRLNALAAEFKFINSASALSYAQNAYEMSQSGPFETAHYQKGLLNSSFLLGICHHLLGHYGPALSFLLDAEVLAEDIGDIRSQADVMLNVAQTYNLLGSLPLALEYALKAIDKCKAAGYLEGEAGAYNSAGIIYDKLGNPQQSLDALQKSVQIHRENGNLAGEAVLLNDIAMRYYTLADFDRALDMAQQCLRLTHQLQLDMLEANVTCTIGEIHFAKGRRTEALVYFRKSIDLARRLGFTYLEMYASMCLGQLHLARAEIEEVDLACQYLQQSLEIAKRLETKSELYRCHQLLAECYKQQGNFERALHHHEQYHLVYQNVFNEASDTRTRNLQITYETEKAQKEAEIYRLKTVDLEREVSQRKKIEAELQQSNDQLWSLRQVDIELTEKLDVAHVLSVALKAAMKLSEAEAGGIWLAEANHLRLAQRAGYYPEQLIGCPLPVETGIYSRILTRPEVVLIPDVNADPDYVPIVTGMNTLIILPLISRQQMMGLISLEAIQDSFTPDILNTLTLLAVRTGVAIDNARAYEELAQLVEELDAFDRTVAHDLKNPLALLIGYSEFLAEDHKSQSDENLHEILQKLANAAHKMTDIVDALLLLSRLRGIADVDVGDVDMAPLIQDVKERLSALIDLRQATIKVPSTWPIARGYPPWIEEVWSNYVSNALKYGGNPPLIEIGANVQPDQTVRFWVHDNGHGLTPEEQSQLFTPFTRLHHTTAEGHGLGLSIVRRIVEKLGGQVAVESTLGEGSTFIFTLPGRPNRN